MSTLKENVQKVVDANAAIKSAIAAKGVTVPAAAKLSDAAALIASIKTGGGSTENEWTPPADYPDLAAMLAADTEDAVGKVFLLYERLGAPGLVTWQIGNISKYTKVTWLDCETGVETQYTTANAVITPTSRFTVVKLYGATKDFIANYETGVPYSGVKVGDETIGFGIRWVAANDCAMKVGYTGWIYANRRWIYAFDGFTVDTTNYKAGTVDHSEAMFRPYKMVAGTNVGTISFASCRNVRSLKDSLVMSACTNCTNMFNGCYSLSAVPDALDLSACTNCTNMFANCYSLTAVPTHITANGENNLQISFASSNFVSKASVEAMAENLNDLTGSAKPPTVTFSSATKALFTTDEWTALKTKFTDKGWNVSPA